MLDFQVGQFQEFNFFDFGGVDTASYVDKYEKSGSSFSHLNYLVST